MAKADPSPKRKAGDEPIPQEGAKAAVKKKSRAKPKKKKPRGLAVFTEQRSVPKRVTAARCVMVLAFAAALPTVVGVEDGRRIFWAAAIAILPISWVVFGYHFWRRICPLAVLSQAARILGIPGNRRVNAKSWLARNYILLQLGIMIVCLSLRLVMTNGTPWALAGFVLAATSVAIAISFFYTGKTWCNYVCPVGMVEKLYTEPSRLAGPDNSQCSPCTACKKNCPDIDLEQGYWKEVDQPARRIAYFSWPGIVLGFYVYFYLVAGNWDYYFSGVWTLDDGQMDGWMAPGFYFFESIPVVLAAPLTLLTFGSGSFLLFAVMEKVARTGPMRSVESDTEKQEAARRVRHQSLALSGFIAFILFYFFGGQPTIRLAPTWIGAIFSVLVVIAASAIFFRRWGRSEGAFVKERFAQKLLKKWQWGDKPVSNDLSDIYLLHHERSAQRESRLVAYKETIREIIADGLVTHGELVILDSLRAQLGVSDKEHQKLLGELSDEDRQLFDPDYQGSVEKRLQQEQYKRELETVIVAAARAGQAPADADLESIRKQHAIDAEEHSAILKRLLDEEGPVVAIFREEIAEVQRVTLASESASFALAAEPDSSSLEYLRYVCHWRARQRLAKSISILAPIASGDLSEISVNSILASGEKADEARALLQSKIDKKLADVLLDLAHRLGDAPPPPKHTDGALLAIANDSSPFLRAAAAHILSRRDDDLAQEAVVQATDDPHPLVRESAFNALGMRGRLKGALVGKAIQDEPLVRQAALSAVRRASGRQEVIDSNAAIEPAESAPADDLYATLNADARLETLTTLEKMMLMRRVPMFSTLDPDDLEQTTLLAQEKRFPPGQDLCQEGQSGEDVFILVSGTVEAWTGSSSSRNVLGESGPGSTIGEMAVFDDAPRSATVTAKGPVRTLVLPGADFKQLMLDRPVIAQSIIGVLVGRLRGMIHSSPPEA